MFVIDIVELKKYIYENNKVEYILEQIGCHSIKRKQNKKNEYITCANPDGDNTSAINVYLTEFLNVVNHTRNILTSKDDTSDLLTLVTFINKQKNKKWKLRDTIIFLHKLLNLKYDKKYKKQKDNKIIYDPLSIFKKIKRRRNTCNIKELDIKGEEILSDFIPLPHISLIRNEGIMPWTCKEFNIGYSPERKRVIFPERYCFGDKNSYLGAMGRTVIKEYEMLDIQKYLPIGDSFDKGRNIYALNENYEYIQNAGYIVVTEGQKSPLRRHSRNDRTCVAIGNHIITDEQRRILISLEVDIIICLDKDIDIHQIRAECEKFYLIRNVYYMFDKWGLLGEKDSPADLEDKLYHFMFKYKVKYDENEHKLYLKHLEEKYG